MLRHAKGHDCGTKVCLKVSPGLSSQAFFQLHICTAVLTVCGENPSLHDRLDDNRSMGVTGGMKNQSRTSAEHFPLVTCQYAMPLGRMGLGSTTRGYVKTVKWILSVKISLLGIWNGAKLFLWAVATSFKKEIGINIELNWSFYIMWIHGAITEDNRDDRDHLTY